MKKFLFLMIGFLIFKNAHAFILRDTIKINKTIDFELDGAGTNEQWDAAQWVSLIQLDSGIRNYDTKFKILYSDAGIYVF